MVDRSKEEQEVAHAPRDDNDKRGAESGSEAASNLRMSPELMLDLARKVSELVAERIENLPGENAWEGEVRQALDDQLFKDRPEDSQPAVDVIERVAREVLPFSTRLDHPRCFGFVPSSPTWPGVLADFMAAGFHINRSWQGRTGAPTQAAYLARPASSQQS